MSILSIITHPVYMHHDTGQGHPERPERILSIMDKVKNSSLKKNIEIVESEKASFDYIKNVHTMDYINATSTAIENGQRILDGGDTVVGEKSMEAALYAAGATVSGIDLLKYETVNKIFCVVRPAFLDKCENRMIYFKGSSANGFCIFSGI